MKVLVVDGDADLRDVMTYALRREGFAVEHHRFVRTADVRYFGQAFEVRVPIPDGPVDAACTGGTVAAFHDAHQRLYGYSFRDDPTQQVEWVNLRITGIGPLRRPTLRPAPDPREPARNVGGPAADPGAAHPQPRVPGAPEREGIQGPDQMRSAVHSPTRAATRPACFDPRSGFVDTAIYRRDDLGPGDMVEGPAVVEEYGATVPLAPRFRAEVDRFGNLIVTRWGAS